MNFKTNSIQTRLTLGLAALVVTAMVLLGGASYWQAKSALGESVDETAYATADHHAQKMQFFMQEALIRLEDLAHIQRIRESADRTAIVGALVENNKRLDMFAMLTYVNLDGKGIRANGTDTDVASRAYFKQVRDTQKPTVSEVIISGSTGKQSVVVAVPILNQDGKMKAILTGTLPLDNLQEELKQVRFKQSGYAFLSDDGGVIIAHPKRPDLVGKLNVAKREINPELKLGTTALDERMITLFNTAVKNNAATRGTYTFVDGVERMAVYKPVELPGGQRWVLMITAPLAEATAEVRHLTYIMLGLGVFCLVLAIGVAVVISRRFTAPIVALRDAAERIAAGDLTMRDKAVQSDDELGHLATSFDTMAANLRALVKQVQRESQQVAAASEELTASSEQAAHVVQQVAGSIAEVASGADHQLAVAQEATREVETLAAELGATARRADGVREAVGKTAQAAEVGGTAINKAIRQMQELDGTVGQSAQVVAKLGARSQEIGQIVDTISGIAGQTNLLALNAAIEAARAGEQGRGFAVVAEEVRKLAEQSQLAAARIAELIGDVQEETERAVAAMQQGTEEVKQGTVVAGQAGEAFAQIVGLIQEVNTQVAAISAAMQQTETSSGKIVQSVEDMQRVSRATAEQTQTVAAATEEQAASMEEIASSSRSLANLAEELQVAVSRFKV